MECSRLDPLFTGVILLVKNAPIFTQAVPTRRTGTASTERIGIAKHTVVVNVETGLPVGVKIVPLGATVVTNLSLERYAIGKTRCVASAVHVLYYSIVANVVLGVEKVKISLQVAL
jgi:hypothetical protein